MESDGRKHPAHHPVQEQLNKPIIVFLTVCTKDRKAILNQHAIHKLLVAAWNTQATWLIGRYVIMPEHIHLFCAPVAQPTESLEKWVSFWKSIVARRWPYPEQRPVWQRHFWDTQLRRDESYSSKWQYVRQNPVRAGFVTDAVEWPYQGELNTLRW